MGPAPSANQKPNYIKDQQQIIKRAERIVKQLELDEAQHLIAQRQHLLARVIIYGHQHLIQHLRSFNHQQRRKFLRFLRNVDYETVDLVFIYYQRATKLFHKLIKNERIVKKKEDYTSYKFYDKRKSLTVEKQDFYRRKGQIALGLGLNQQKISYNQFSKSKNSVNQASKRKKIFDIEKQQQMFKQIDEDNKTGVTQKTGIALVVFMGGQSTRFSAEKGKQIYKQKQQQQCLFQVILKQLKQLAESLIGKHQIKDYQTNQSIQKLKDKFPEVYLICNEKNTRQISLVLKKFTQPPLQNNIPQQFEKPSQEANQLAFMSELRQKFIVCMQNTQPIVNLNGKICLSSDKAFQIVQMPNGCGDFIKCSVKYQRATIIEDMKKKQIKYVHCIGCQNYLTKVLDPFMLGYLIDNKQNLDVVFKCTYPQKQSQQFLRVVYKDDKKRIKIDSFQRLIQNSSRKTDPDIIRKSPVWMNSIMFSFPKFSNYLQQLKVSPQLVHMFNTEKRKISYWDAVNKIQHTNQYCYIFERYLSDILISQHIKARGIMVEREQQFLPVIGLDEKDDQLNNWRQAYKQYSSREEKRSVLRQLNMGMVSLVSMMSDGDEEVQNNNPRLWMDHIVE